MAAVPLVNFSNLKGFVVWSPLTDSVRGGKSTAFLEIQPDQTAKIFGELTLIENAGFASYRVIKVDHQAWDLQNAASLIVDAAGDGRTYKVLLKDKAAATSPQDYSWEAPLPSTSQMHSTFISLSDFKPYFRGRELSGVPPLNKSQIQQMGIQINDKMAGLYSFRLKAISAE